MTMQMDKEGCPRCKEKGYVEEVSTYSTWSRVLLNLPDADKENWDGDKHFYTCRRGHKYGRNEKTGEVIPYESPGQGAAEDYSALKTAVEDLLCELRIDPASLEMMAIGFSPNYSGLPDRMKPEGWTNPFCKVQLSSVVALKLKLCGVGQHK
jgi:hypothetical protein